MLNGHPLFLFEASSPFDIIQRSFNRLFPICAIDRRSGATSQHSAISLKSALTLNTHHIWIAMTTLERFYSQDHILF